ncbi:MAG: hypothetical protein JSS22_20680 [Proteobacteria bacterium]|nr:hypothetical protein [Pseudomonadota bacterium]
MVIVTVTRNDLRDEFAMADEAFALSPISARAALPSEADYDAIREAFMETSRGRWFLTEYAKRNRNADTTMVLDAVARIEQSMAAQQQKAPDDGLAKVLAVIRGSLDEARNAAAAAFDKPARDAALAPIQKGVRIIREISWRWREIGGDSRICDLLDSQADAIDEVHAQLAARDDLAALDAALGLIETTLETALGELPNSPAAAASRSRTDTESSSAESSSVESFTPAAGGDEPRAPIKATTASEQAIVATDVSKDAAIVATSEAHAAAAGATTVTGQSEDLQNKDLRSEDLPAGAMDAQDMAHDDAVLDMIALEMGASDFDGPEMDHLGVGAPVVAEPATIAESSNTSIAPEPETATIAVQPSLGASLLASGIVARARPRSDPLAPIRRMTQAEKIAFFS